MDARITRRGFIAVAGAGIAALVRQPSGPRAMDVSPIVASGPADRIAGATGWPPMDGSGPRVVVAGIGRAGCGAVSALYGRLTHATYIAFDAGGAGLDRTLADMKVPIDPSTPGPGRDGGPDHGRRATWLQAGAVADALSHADLAFVVGDARCHVAAVGAPVIAQLARDAGALSFAVVTRPAAGDADRGDDRAEAAVRQLSRICDATILVPDDGSAGATGGGGSQDASCAGIDAVVAAGVRAIAGIACFESVMLSADFADVRAVLARRGAGVLGLGAAAGPDRAGLAAVRAFGSPLLGGFALDRAGGVLVCIAAARYEFAEIERVLQIVCERAGDDTPIAYGDIPDPGLGDVLQVTIVAAGDTRRGVA